MRLSVFCTLLVVTLCISAFAEADKNDVISESGIYLAKQDPNLTVCKMVDGKAETINYQLIKKDTLDGKDVLVKAPATAKETDEGIYFFYPDAQLFKYTAKPDGKEYLILLLKDDGTGDPKPTKDTIKYIDQSNSTETTFVLYPSSIDRGVYYVKYSTADGSGLVPLTEFTSFIAAILGDVDGDGSITANDALCALMISVGMENEGKAWTSAQIQAAKVTAGDPKVTSSDALDILMMSVGMITSFSIK